MIAFKIGSYMLIVISEESIDVNNKKKIKKKGDRLGMVRI